MNKKIYFLLWLTVLFLVSPTSSSAYNLGMDVNQFGYIKYSYPTVLGDEDKPEEQRIENKQESNKQEEKKPEKVEVKETPRVEKPEKIEIKKEENKIKVEFKRQEKVEQEMKPEKVSLKFSAVPKTTPVHEPESEDIGGSKVDDDTDDTDKVLEDRSQRKDEKIEIQSEVHDDGTVEMQIESRTVKAKIKNSEIELDVKNNNIGSTDNEGNKMELVHLPDQAMQKFLDMGVSATPDTLEVGQSGNSFEYTVDAVKIQKLFGLIPRETKFKLSLNDSTGTVEQKATANNLIEQILNLFSF